MKMQNDKIANDEPQGRARHSVRAVSAFDEARRARSDAPCRGDGVPGFKARLFSENSHTDGRVKTVIRKTKSLPSASGISAVTLKLITDASAVTIVLTCPAASAGAAAKAPTFTENIAPIIFQNCVSCHRPGEIGPFPLLTYQDVRKH